MYMASVGGGTKCEDCEPALSLSLSFSNSFIHYLANEESGVETWETPNTNIDKRKIDFECKNQLCEFFVSQSSRLVPHASPK